MSDDIARLTARLAETLRTDTTDAGYAEAVDAADDLVKLVRAVVRDELRQADGPAVITREGDCQGPCCGGNGPVNWDH